MRTPGRPAGFVPLPWLAWTVALVVASCLPAPAAAQGSRDPTPPAVRRSAVTRGALVQPATAAQLAAAMGIPSSDLLSADLGASATAGVGVGTAPFGRFFPTAGPTFAILSTGAAGSADLPNDAPSTSTVLPDLNNSQGYDMVQLRLLLQPPPGARCLAFDFAFYSEEFPEFVGSTFNDFFLAELGGSTFQIVGSTIDAPLNFARDTAGNEISVNTLFGITEDTATTYDGATPLLRAVALLPETATVELVLTISDLGDSSYDSAVFLDGFAWLFTPDCSTGTTVIPESALLTAGNPEVIGIPSGLGEPPLYPSSIDVGSLATTAVKSLGRVPNPGGSADRVAVAGTPGRIRKLTVTLRNFSYAYGADLDVLLVGPEGQAVMLMSDVGGNFLLDNLTLTFDDDADLPLPVAAPLRSGTYRPTNRGAVADFAFAAPADGPPPPPGPYASSLAVFKGTSPLGTWRLFVRDDLTGDGGSIDQGWELTILTGPLAPAAHDLDGDGRADVGVYRRSGAWTVQRSLEGIVTTVAFGDPTLGDVPVPGDFDGDGVTDLTVYRASTGEWFSRHSADVAVFSFSFAPAFGPPQPGDTPIPADYDGDGITDPAIYRAATGAFLIRRSSDGAIIAPCCAVPALGDVPIPADYDGDGKADLAVYRAATEELFLFLSSTLTLVQLCCGNHRGLDPVFIPADYDGDGRADLAVYRRVTGEFFFLRSSDLVIGQACCADPSAGDIPVVADYDGDGKADLAVYRPTTGTFYVLQSSDATLRAVPLVTPAPGDVPSNHPFQAPVLPPPPAASPMPDPQPDPEEPMPQPSPCKDDPEREAPTC